MGLQWSALLSFFHTLPSFLVVYIMPIALSVGDIFAGIQLFGSINDALASSTGSQAQYNGVLGTLQSLESALTSLQPVATDCIESQLIGDIIGRIKETLARFHAKLSKYSATLGPGSKAKWWRSLPRKIQWQHYSAQDVQSFHSELLSHASALQLGLASMQQ